MEEWKEKLIAKARADFDKSVESMLESVKRRRRRNYETMNLKIRAIQALREQPQDVWGDDSVYIITENHLLAHDIAREFHVKLEKKGRDDGVNYKGKIDGNVGINVYGPTEIPGCKLVKKTRQVTEHYFELECNPQKT